MKWNSTQLKIISKSFNLFLVSEIKWPWKKRLYCQLWIPRLHEIKIFREPSLCCDSPVIREMIIPLTRLYLHIDVSHIQLDMCLPSLLFLRGLPAQASASPLIKRLARGTITNDRIAFLLLLQKHLFMSMNLFQGLLLSH